jgi:hypothetical protein
MSYFVASHNATRSLICLGSVVTVKYASENMRNFVKLQSRHSQLILYTRNIPSAVCVAPPEHELVMLEICRVPCFSVN